MGRKVTQDEPEDKIPDYFNLVRSGLDGFVLVHEMEEVRVVPTLFTSYNRATGRGGHPLGRLVLIHGPNQVGKSVLSLAILESLARAGFPGHNEDSEMAAEKRWYTHICRSKRIVDKPVMDLDELFDDVKTLLTNVQEAQASKKMPKEIGAAISVDTLTKLMPRKILEIIEKEGIDKQYPIQALHISTWMKWVIPMIWKTNSSLVVVLQERENVDKRGPFDKGYKVTLGRALQYDNSLRVRVTGSERVKRGDKIIGIQCHFSVENNKIDGTTLQAGSYFTSNGEGDCPIGLDLVSEAAEEAKARGWLKSKGGQWVLELFDLDEETGEEKRIGKDELGKTWPAVWSTLWGNKLLFRNLVLALNKNASRVVIEEK
jgi:RecA/RadA recombinase